MILEDSSQSSDTREQKERLLRHLLEQKEILDQTRLLRFQPNPGLNGEKGFQEKFIRSLKRVRLVTAGNQSGKTHLGAWDHACLQVGVHPFRKMKTPTTAFIVTAKPHSEGIEKDIIPKLKEVVGSRDIVDIKNNSRGVPYKIIWRTGSVSYMLSCEQDDIVFEGTTWGHGWFDEPPPRHIYIAMERGLLTSGGPVSFTCTPLEEPWLYDEIYIPGMMGTDPDIAVFEGSSDENRKIDAAAKKRFFNKLDPDEIETRWHGKFRHLMGRVFKSYDHTKHLIKPFRVPRHWPTWLSIDPHRNKPHAVLFLTISPENIKYICNEIYVKCTIDELADFITDIESQYNMVDRLIDTSAQEDGWGRVSARELLNDKGVRTKLAQKKNKKASGITFINQIFHQDQMFVFDTCIRTHRELSLQAYEKHKSDQQVVLEVPQKKFDDMTDNLRYILVERPDYSGPARIHEVGPIYTRG